MVTSTNVLERENGIKQSHRAPAGPRAVGFIGSRSLSHTVSEKVGLVVEDMLARKYRIASGGAVGADEFCLSHLVHIGEAEQATVYSPWKDYTGFPLKVRALTRQFREFGGSIVWGNVSEKDQYLMVRTALLQRNMRLVEAVDGIIAFIQGKSSGTLFTLKKAIREHLPIVVFAFETQLPEIAGVKWRPLRAGGCWEGGYKAVYLR